MTFFQSADGTQIHEEAWLPAGPAQAVVVLSHGYGEHIGRYEATAKELTRAGFRVHGYDQRGHGQSGGVRGFARNFDEYITDLQLVIQRAREGRLPLFLLGHSFGGLVSAHYALRHSGDLSGLILTSPYFALRFPAPKFKLIAAQVFSRLVPKLALPTGLKGTDVSRDPEIAAAYDRDPLNNKNATARWFTESSAAQEAILARAGELRLPVLVIQGAADRVADASRTQAVFDRMGSTDKTLRMLSEQYHEVLNEPPADRQKTITEIVNWLKAHHKGTSLEKLQAGGA
jgi:alpha-beta hydrolase superfamily lysophospholipase